MRTFVIGDIHGAYKALLQCLELSKFNKNNDRLICLGDVCDRGSHVKECIDELLTIPKCVYVLGNHDEWALEWAIHGNLLKEWMEDGGSETLMSYKGIGMPKAHTRFLAKAPLYFVDKNRLFVHGGYDSERSVEETPNQTFLWDRSLLKEAECLERTCPDWKFGGFDEIFVGHTPTLNYGKYEPQKFCNVWAMDTGAGWGGYLTIMDVDTKKFWQTEVVQW
jgi:serine/threonine protein phosphatase 1